MVLPKVYNGKDKTFFFVDYEGYRRDSQQLLLGNVPTAKMRTGETISIFFASFADIHGPGRRDIGVCCRWREMARSC